MKKTILIVEDDGILLEALENKFMHEGFDVLSAKNGLEGLNILSDKKIDLILLDIVMPIMDGLTMLKKLRETKLERQPEVIMLTNLSGADSMSEAIANGSYDYLIKADWKIEDLVKKVKEKIN